MSAELVIKDCVRFATLLSDEPCQLYAHALREAANSAYMQLHDHNWRADGDYRKCSCGAMERA